jgi:hypothetical protein
MRRWHSIIAIGIGATFFGCVGAGSSTAGPDLFAPAYEVLHHPRCSNCHPTNDDRPRWGEGSAVHDMNVQGGEDQPESEERPAGRYGRVGMQCVTCHQEDNSEVPGNPPGAHDSKDRPRWRLAPSTMGWGGFGQAELCRDFRGRIEKVMDHLLEPHTDPLVIWAWNPGPGRQPAPGSLKQFVSDMIKWKESGAPCPGD